MKIKNKKRINEGSITVEACLVIPLFLFFMLAMADIMMLFMAEAHIHQSLIEAAGYMAQYAYLEDKLVNNENKGKILVDSVIMNQKFREYLGEDYYVEKIIAGGKSGIILTIKQDADNPKIFLARAGYQAGIDVPILGKKVFFRSNRVKQKAFVGYSSEEQAKDTYVYVTPEQSVYHLKRSCTHLSLSVHSVENSQKGSYTPCSFCGRESNKDGKIFISRTTNVYHNNAGCSGLKRSVKRVKKSEVGGLGPCSRCGR